MRKKNKERSNQIKFLQKLKKQGIFFGAQSFNGCFDLCAKRVIAYAENPFKFEAKRYGFSEEAFQEFLDNEQRVRCIRTNKNGLRCETLHSPSPFGNVKEYKENYNKWLCHRHNGIDTDEEIKRIILQELQKNHVQKDELVFIPMSDFDHQIDKGEVTIHKAVKRLANSGDIIRKEPEGNKPAAYSLPSWRGDND